MFGLFESGRFTQVLLYCDETKYPLPHTHIPNRTVSLADTDPLMKKGKHLIYAINRDWGYNQTCRLSHNITATSHSFITLDDLFELIRKRGLSNESFLIYLNCHKTLARICLVAEEFSSQHCTRTNDENVLRTTR